ncbi:MAG: DNA topoisomerase [Lachnospiraceae bacterium]
MRVIIAEKPDLAKDIGTAILTTTRQEKQYVTGKGFDGEDYIIVSSYGHLMELADPEEYDEKYQKWELSDLPIAFHNWKIVPSKEAYKRIKLEVIGKLLQQCDCVIHAGDPDEEGQLLIDEILAYFQFHGQVYRVFVNDNLAVNIRKEFQNLKENQPYLAVGESANARRIADKCFGINESRLAGIRLHRKGLSVGRVQTPTLGLVVTRDLAIEQHIKERYFDCQVILDMEGHSDLVFGCSVDKEYLKAQEVTRIMDRTFFEELQPNIQNGSLITTVIQEKITHPPLPYNLTKLQSDMNQWYGYSMSQTLDITQDLRSKYKAISYNRSDCQYLKTEHFQLAKQVFSTILNGEFETTYPLNYTLKSACFHDENVSAHHGIIPQATNVSVANMTEEEGHVYLAICKRYALQFLPPKKAQVSNSTFTVSDGTYTHLFTYQAEKVLEKGYTQYIEEPKKPAKEFVQSGTVPITKIKEYVITEKETKPLQKYTEASLGVDMSSIAKYVVDPEIRAILKQKDNGKKGENGSIGTVATRGEIVNGLLKKGFLEAQGKHIVSTTLGREFYQVLPPEISSPDTTAKWWLLQEAIKEGQADVNAIQDAVVAEFLLHKESAYAHAQLSGRSSEEDVVGKCPVCGNPVVIRKGKFGKFYCCTQSSVPETNCHFSMPGCICNKNITQMNAKELLDKGHVKLSKMKGKSGKEFSATIVLKVENGKGKFEFKF